MCKVRVVVGSSASTIVRASPEQRQKKKSNHQRIFSFTADWERLSFCSFKHDHDVADQDGQKIGKKQRTKHSDSENNH